MTLTAIGVEDRLTLALEMARSHGLVETIRLDESTTLIGASDRVTSLSWEVKGATPWHWHFQSETLTVESGEIQVQTERSLITVSAGSAIHLPAETVHRVSSEGAEVKVLFEPGIRLEGTLDPAN